MFTSICTEMKKLALSFLKARREQHDAVRGGEGNNPIYRMVEAERVHTNFLSVILASIVLFFIEAGGMIWAVINKIKFDYGTGFLISCTIFTVVAFVFIIVIERKLKDPDFSLKQKRLIYRMYWIIYCLEAMSFSVMELLDRGTVNNYLCFVFVFTVLPIIEPLPKTLVLVVSFAIETVIMLKVGAQDPDNILICLVAILLAAIASYATFFRYMTSKITEKRLEHFANGDQLTMLTNRRGFAATAPAIKKYCEKNSQKLLVLMADIDDFKLYNDTYGHLEGDICLKNVADKIRENFSRPTDICARYGGEEFVVLSAVNDEQRVIEHIMGLLKSVEESTGQDGKSVTLSMGLVLEKNPAKSDINEFIGIADRELYNAKANGKNCLSYNGTIYRN